ncbi:MAG: OmpA family protein [FCB group bacterium]|nr:OmpA family protein [FCB group bacterium]
MKNLLIVSAISALLFLGCGASKDYVSQQISQSESKTNAQINSLRDKTNANAEQLSKLQSLSKELAAKTDMAINKAKGFENYQIIWKGEINFDFDSYLINANAEQILNEAGKKMEEHPGSIIEIAGYTDRTGSAKYNLMLGEERANAAKRFLADQYGISLYRMFVISYGKQKPIALPDEKHASSKNRRVILTIWGELK